ncbi:MAG: MATE family efflux transporter [Turicibacter sp.]|nr:MATE family efflux transporter [Turicibacter sp.]
MIGDSKRPLYYLSLSSVINIILDVVFVVGFKMGVASVALATLIAQAVSAILLMIQLMRSKESYSVHLKEIKVDKFILREITIVGIPTGLQQVIISLSNAIVQSSINSFGSDAIAGCSAYLKLDGFMILPIMSFSMAATTFTGQNLGAKQYGRIYKGMRTSLLITTIYTVSACLLMYFFGAETLRIFTQDENVLHYGRVMLDTIVPAYLSLALM